MILVSMIDAPGAGYSNSSSPSYHHQAWFRIGWSTMFCMLACQAGLVCCPPDVVQHGRRLSIGNNVLALGSYSQSYTVSNIPMVANDAQQQAVHVSHTLWTAVDTSCSRW